MRFDFLFPPSEESKTVKDCIVNILSQQSGLSARRIYSATRKSGRHVSYQAAYKALKELCSDGVVVKTGKEYALSMDWIERIYTFSRRMKSRQTRRRGAIENLMDMLSHRESVVLEFPTIMDLDEFSHKLHSYFYPKVKGKPVIMYFSHQWWHLLYPEKEYRCSENNRNFYMVCFGNTALDRHNIEVSKTRGFNITLTSAPMPCDMTVYGDIIINVHFDSGLSESLEQEFSSVRKLDQLHVPGMIDRVFRKRSRILMIANRNRFAADRIRERTLALFEK